MTFGNEGYQPETIEFLEVCLEMASATASALADEPVDEVSRQKMAMALIDGMNAGLTQRANLVEFALAALPSVRWPRRDN